MTKMVAAGHSLMRDFRHWRMHAHCFLKHFQVVAALTCATVSGPSVFVQRPSQVVNSHLVMNYATTHLEMLDTLLDRRKDGLRVIRESQCGQRQWQTSAELAEAQRHCLQSVDVRREAKSQSDGNTATSGPKLAGRDWAAYACCHLPLGEKNGAARNAWE